MPETIIDAGPAGADTPAVDTTVATTTTPAPVTAKPETTTPVATTTPVESSKPSWPENWREALAGQDEKRLKQLQRYSDPTAFANKTFALEAKLSSGEYRRDLPKDASPEQVAEWRKEHGLPDKPEDYKIELPEGVVLGEADKPVIDNFKQFALENNLSPDVLNKTLSWYYKNQDAVNQQREMVDASFHDEAKDSLIAEWGLKDYRANLSAMASIRDQMPEGLADRMLAGRTADGRLIGDDPQFLTWFASLSRELNPQATVVAFDSGKTLDSELDQIRKFRRENPDKYDQDQSMQARERELLDAQIKTRSRKMA